MESELKDLTTTTNNHIPESSLDDAASSNPDRPLLTSDSSSSTSTVPSITAAESVEMEKKYAAYVRRDVYGTMGRGPLPIVEKLLLGVASVTLLPIRVFAAIAILVVYYVICRVCTLFVGDGEEEEYGRLRGVRRDVIIASGRFLSRLMLFVFGFHWIPVTDRGIDGREKSGDESKNKDLPEEQERPGVIISNHVSYLDILYHMSSSFPSFVAKVCWSIVMPPVIHFYSAVHCDSSLTRATLFDEEISGETSSCGHNQGLDEQAGRWLIVETLTKYSEHMALLREFELSCPFISSVHFKCLGCVFVQRESKSSDFRGVSGVVTERIKEATESDLAPPMMLFPEGTTTNGDYLLPFKTGAFLAKAPVLPIILRYPYQRFSPAWDSISGFRHVILLLCQFTNHIEVTRLPVYYPSKEEKDDPKLYASNVRRLMADEGKLIMSDIGLPEKRIYHAALNGNNSFDRVSHQKAD